MSFEKPRECMINNQLRTWDVQDEAVLAVMGRLPREHFVPKAYEGVAYADTTIPIGSGQFMLPPKWVGRMLQSLALHSADTVLEIGTGTGYVTDCLAHLCFHVFSIEVEEAFHQQAKENLKKHACTNVSLFLQDGSHGLDKHGPYDAIVSTAAFKTFPTALGAQLREGGRLFCVLGDAPAMQACLFQRLSGETWTKQVLFETDIPLIRLANSEQAFQF